MSEEIRVSKPVTAPVMNQPGMPEMAPRRGGSKMPWLVLAVVIVIILVIGFLFKDKIFMKKDASVKGASTEKLSGYQAVFLTNGQVYFGNLSDATDTYVTLKHIYYLQVNNQNDLQGSQDKQQAQAQPQISLVKLGDELHGPDDSMKINRDQVLFIEDMKESAKVVQAIKEYEANPNAGQQQQSQTQSQGQQQQSQVQGATTQTPATQQAPATTTPATK